MLPKQQGTIAVVGPTEMSIAALIASRCNAEAIQKRQKSELVLLFLVLLYSYFSE